MRAYGEERNEPINEPLIMLKNIADSGTIKWDLDLEGVRKGHMSARFA